MNDEKKKQQAAQWLKEWYANSVSGSVLADHAAGNVQVIDTRLDEVVGD